MTSPPVTEQVTLKTRRRPLAKPLPRKPRLSRPPAGHWKRFLDPGEEEPSPPLNEDLGGFETA